MWNWIFAPSRCLPYSSKKDMKKNQLRTGIIFLFYMNKIPTYNSLFYSSIKNEIRQELLKQASRYFHWITTDILSFVVGTDYKVGSTFPSIFLQYFKYLKFYSTAILPHFTWFTNQEVQDFQYSFFLTSSSWTVCMFRAIFSWPS